MAETSGTVGREVFVAYPWKLYSSRASYKRAYTSLERALVVRFVFAEERISSGHVLEKIEEMIQADCLRNLRRVIMEPQRDP